MRKSIIIAVFILFAIALISGAAKALTIGQAAPSVNSYLKLRDGGSTQKDWCIWFDSTNEVLRCSSCEANGGAECPDETPFDETDGQVVGSQS